MKLKHPCNLSCVYIYNDYDAGPCANSCEADSKLAPDSHVTTGDVTGWPPSCDDHDARAVLTVLLLDIMECLACDIHISHERPTPPCRWRVSIGISGLCTREVEQTATQGSDDHSGHITWTRGIVWGAQTRSGSGMSATRSSDEGGNQADVYCLYSSCLCSYLPNPWLSQVPVPVGWVHWGEVATVIGYWTNELSVRTPAF